MLLRQLYTIFLFADICHDEFLTFVWLMCSAWHCELRVIISFSCANLRCKKWCSGSTMGNSNNRKTIGNSTATTGVLKICIKQESQAMCRIHVFGTMGLLSSWSRRENEWVQLRWSGKGSREEFRSIKCTQEKLIPGTPTGFFWAMGNSEAFEYMEKRGLFPAPSVWIPRAMTAKTWSKLQEANSLKRKGPTSVIVYTI